MLRQFLVGAAVSASNIMIHAVVMAAVVRVAQIANAKNTSQPWLVRTSQRRNASPAGAPDRRICACLLAWAA
jgi:hypothetical protein